MKIPFQKLKVLSLMLTAGLTCAPALAQQTSTATASTQAVIVKPISIQKTTDLSFGRLATIAGTASISAINGDRSADINPMLVTTLGTEEATTPSRATFTVGGEPNLTYAISAPETSITLENSTTPSESLILTLTGVHVLSTNLTGTPAGVSTGTLSSTGSDTLGIGGRLTLENDTPSGIYANAEGIALTVNYN